MSLLDKAIAAITPPESDEARAKARARAEAAATPGDWLSQVLDHHRRSMPRSTRSHARAMSRHAWRRKRRSA